MMGYISGLCCVSGQGRSFSLDWRAVVLTVLTLASIITVITAQQPHVGNSRRLHKRSVIMDRGQLFADTKGYPKLDIIFALERSNVWPNTKRNFVIEQKKFVRSLIRDFLYVMPNSTRVALITYASDVRIIFDGITQNPITKCDLIASSYIYGEVKFIDGPTSQSVNLDGVFNEARNILRTGRTRRPNSRSALILLTSGQYREFTPSIHRDWFDTYGVGINDNVDMRKVSRIIANSHTNIYGTIREWQETMRISMESFHVAAGVDPLWTPYNGCRQCQWGSCWCDVITGFTRCGCDQGYVDDNNFCNKPCKRRPCPRDLFDCVPTFQGINYECKCKRNNPSCDIRRVKDCNASSDPCQNGGTCYDGKNQYACVCPPGFWGMHCEINENECNEWNLCANGETCQDAINSYDCAVRVRPEPPIHPPIQPPVPTLWVPPKAAPTPTRAPFVPHIPTVPFTKAPTTAGAGKTSGDDKKKIKAASDGGDSLLSNLNDRDRLLLTIIPPAGLGLIFLLIGIGSLIYVLRSRNDRKKSDTSGITETTSVISHTPSLVTLDSKCYTNEGTPGPPKMPKAVEANENRVSYGEFDDVLYGNEALQRGMEGWYAYVLELYHNHGFNRILIIRLDGEKWVLSPGSKLYMDEVEAIFNLLSKKMIQGSFKVQGREFGIVGNNDFVIMAHTFRNSKRAQEILCATKTRQFVIIGSADFSTDGGRCKEKVLELRDHIKVQGL